MLEWFKCPDNEMIPYQECLTKCRLDSRCLTLPTLQLVARQREWNGIASTTQLLDGTMYVFLKIAKPYTVDPDKAMFAIHGEGVHGLLKKEANELGLPAEVALTTEDRDIFDLLEPDCTERKVTFDVEGKPQGCWNGTAVRLCCDCDSHGTYTLTDYKTWGSFKVAKALGIVQTGKKPDPSGEVYKRSGAWGSAGSPKMVSVFQAMPQQADNWEAELQLNRYRVMIEEKFAGLKVSHMQVQVLVRDGGLQVARGRGIERNSMLIPVKMMADSHVREFFNIKNGALTKALAAGIWDQPCTAIECWDGVRCRDYCEVNLYCTKGMIEMGGSR